LQFFVPSDLEQIASDVTNEQMHKSIGAGNLVTQWRTPKSYLISSISIIYDCDHTKFYNIIFFKKKIINISILRIFK